MAAQVRSSICSCRRSRSKAHASRDQPRSTRKTKQWRRSRARCNTLNNSNGTMVEACSRSSARSSKIATEAASEASTAPRSKAPPDSFSGSKKSIASSTAFSASSRLAVRRSDVTNALPMYLPAASSLAVRSTLSVASGVRWKAFNFCSPFRSHSDASSRKKPSPEGMNFS